jgi:uncharacterized protein (DUF885 family)
MNIVKKTLLMALPFLVLACTKQEPQTTGVQPVNSATLLNDAVKKYTEDSKHLDPFYASYFNVDEDLGKFGDYASPEYYARSKKIYADALAGIAKVDVATLNENDQRTYRLFKEDMEVNLKGFDYPNELLSFHQMSNRLHAYIDDSSEALTTFPFDTVKHYDDFVNRSAGFLPYVNNQIAQLRDGLKRGIVLSCTVVKQIPNTYVDGLEKNIEKNPFWRPITFMPKTFSEADKTRLKSNFKKIISERIVPGFMLFHKFFINEYTPKCRDGFGLAGLPDDKNWYQYQIRANTNLNLEAAAIHQIGLDEVKRIYGEIEKTRAELGFKGAYKEFLKSLLVNKKYFFKSAKEMFDAFSTVKAETALKIDSFFSLKPKSDFKIVETSNPEDAAGSYNNPTEMIPYGRFVANTKNLRSVPTYEVTTLMLHETVPGHHYQLALQFEMKDQLSEYQRKLFNSNSFVEGWALYSEFLGNEMGMYKDPLQKLGNLNDEMLRAVRLVVDTGIHSEGWSQEKAKDYMAEYLANDPKDIANEVNRYSVWPGQALGYKLGQLKIIELRRMAEKTLGPKFDIKEFHRVVIGQGTVSLGELETQVKQWVAASVK